MRDFAECDFTNTAATVSDLVPPVQVVQALYMDNPQDYLDAETRLAVAKYMLQMSN